jgi:hypothetical protein
MFAQVIQGNVSDPDAVKAATDRWVRDLAPGADGWLGSTGGTTDDGRYVTVVRFESEEAAQRNSNRPEQGSWWAETEKLFGGGATFQDSTDVTLDLHGDPNRAGFVQIIQGRGTDPQQARELFAKDSDKWAAFRPDLIGSVLVGHQGGAYTMVLYFTSEADARKGERKELPPELQANMDELNRISTGQPEFFDLRQPVILSPQ